MEELEASLLDREDQCGHECPFRQHTLQSGQGRTTVVLVSLGGIAGGLRVMQEDRMGGLAISYQTVWYRLPSVLFSVRED